MKRILAIAALAGAALAFGSAEPASAASLPSKGEPLVCTIPNLAYATAGYYATATGSGTCTGLLGLQRYSALAIAVWGGSGCPPSSLPMLLTLSTADGQTRPSR